MVFALFCFVAYYWSENPKPTYVYGLYIGSYPAHHIPNSGDLFFVLGNGILVLSMVMLFVLNYKTVVDKNSLIISGFPFSKKISIGLDAIVSVKKLVFLKPHFKITQYYLRRKGTSRFYTFGSEAVELIDKQGNKYIIGSQKANELIRVIKNNKHRHDIN
jgi:hypothetical protein